MIGKKLDKTINVKLEYPAQWVHTLHAESASPFTVLQGAD
jgi:hypothetical protein